jgi:hypothetical protein
MIHIAGGHEVAANSTALDVSKWGLAAAQVREVAGALPQLRCLRELVLDGVPVSGAIPRNGDFKYGAETVDADLGTFRALCEGLRACQGLASLSLKKCYVGTQALALLADLIKVIAALTTLRCGSNPGMVGELYPSGDLRTPDVHIEALQQLLDALKPSGVTELDISKIGIGPVGVGRVADYVREAKAALNSLTCDSTGVPFVHYVDRHATGPRTYTLTVGEAAIDLSSKNFGPADVTLLTVWMKRPEVMAALASVNCSGNGLTGAVKKNGQWNKVNSDLSGFVSLCTVLGKVTEVNLSDCGLGPASMPELVKMFSDPSATLKKVVLSHNFIFGSKDLRMYDRTQIHDIDADQSGWTALCDALPASPVEELDVANVGMGVAGVTSLAKAISAGAALAKVNVLSNPIGADGVDALIEVYEQNTNLRTLLGIEEGVTELNLSEKNVDPGQAKILAAELNASRAAAAIENVNVSGCNVTQESAAQLLTAANEASRARLRAHQVLAFSEALHVRLGSECLLQAVAIDADVWRRVAENVRERHGHEVICSQLAQAGQTWFEVTVEGLIAEGVSR